MLPDIYIPRINKINSSSYSGYLPYKSTDPEAILNNLFAANDLWISLYKPSGRMHGGLAAADFFITYTYQYTDDVYEIGFLHKNLQGIKDMMTLAKEKVLLKGCEFIDRLSYYELTEEGFEERETL